MTELVNLLNDTIVTPHQLIIKDVKYPCTGFCYMVAANRQQIKTLFNLKDKKGYYDLILKLLNNAGERKRNNKNIDEDGEYINHDTVKKDFGDLFNNMMFSEMACPDEENYNITINNLFLFLVEMSLDGFMIVTRSKETFIIIKLSNNKFLIVDSHQTIHGSCGLEGVTRYVLKDGKYKNLIQIGLYQ